MILIAEDDSLNSLLLEKIVSDLGYSVKMVGDGQKVIDSCANQKFDLLLIDMSMPEVDGEDAIAAIRVPQNVNYITPILLLSGTYPKNYNELQEKYSLSGIILKPFTLEGISQSIQKYI